MARSAAQKMGIKEAMRSYFVNAPEQVLRTMALPRLEVEKSLDGLFEYLHLFVESQASLDRKFPELKAHLGPGGKLWVSWPKGRQLGTDLTLPHVIRIGYSHGLVESTVLSINELWSAIKFTHPKPGKTYSNSFGQLPDG